MMSLGASIAKVMWPFFVKYIWPFILEHLTDLASKSLKLLAENIWEAAQKRLNRSESDARTKADEAEHKANASTDQSEREKLESIANIWRQVAEQHKAEIEVLKKQIDDMLANQLSATIDEMHKVDPTVTNEKENIVITVGDDRLALPAPKNPDKDK